MKRGYWVAVLGAGAIGWILLLGRANSASQDTVLLVQKSGDSTQQSLSFGGRADGSTAPPAVTDSTSSGNSARRCSAAIREKKAFDTESPELSSQFVQQNPCINVNTSTANELTELPGIGEVIAGRIVDFRTENGPFGKPEQLEAVKGIGPARLKRIQSLICF